MAVHIEGLGGLGAQLALALADRGEPFTWHDSDDPFNAWGASTGCVYPSGEHRHERGRQAWLAAIEHGHGGAEFAAIAPYRFAQKEPPHKAGYAVADLGKVREAGSLAVTVNVARMVERVRARFADRRTTEAPPRATVAVCHTTPERGDGYLWGWSAPVAFTEPLPSPTGRAVWTGKKHRYDNTYAYPVPGEGYWLAGSTMLMVRSPRVRDVGTLLDVWTANARDLFGIEAQQVGAVRQGWRPRAKRGDSGAVERHGDRWLFPPAAASGIQVGPLLAREFIEEAL